MQLADDDENGLLSYKEIRKFCEACLSRFMKSDATMFLESLTAYFTKLVFETLGYTYDQEIPLSHIGKHILKGGVNSHLLSMFCGADF